MTIQRTITRASAIDAFKAGFGDGAGTAGSTSRLFSVAARYFYVQGFRAGRTLYSATIANHPDYVDVDYYIEITNSQWLADAPAEKE